MLPAPILPAPTPNSSISCCAFALRQDTPVAWFIRPSPRHQNDAEAAPRTQTSFRALLSGRAVVCIEPPPHGMRPELRGCYSLPAPVRSQPTSLQVRQLIACGKLAALTQFCGGGFTPDGNAMRSGRGSTGERETPLFSSGPASCDSTGGNTSMEPRENQECAAFALVVAMRNGKAYSTSTSRERPKGENAARRALVPISCWCPPVGFGTTVFVWFLDVALAATTSHGVCRSSRKGGLSEREMEILIRTKPVLVTAVGGRTNQSGKTPESLRPLDSTSRRPTQQKKIYRTPRVPLNC